MNQNLFVFFGRHKCATRYVSSVLSNYAETLGLGYTSLSMNEYRTMDWVIKQQAFRERIARASPYTNIIRDLLDKYQVPYKGFHLVRDPRDMVVSGYFSHLNSHPERWIFQKQHFNKIRGLPQEEGLHEEIDYSGWLEFDDMLAWDTTTSHIEEIQFEQLTSSPKETFARLLEFSDLPVEINVLEQIIDHFSFEKLSGGRKKGEENTTHHYRSGVAGDWKRYLSDANLRYFMDKYGSLLEKYGYEK